MPKEKEVHERFPDVYDALLSAFDAGYSSPLEMREEKAKAILCVVAGVVLDNQDKKKKKKKSDEGYGKGNVS